MKLSASPNRPACAGPISVVVVNFNGAAHLSFCLEAIFAQSLAPDEVLLVDNASSDGSETAALERYPKLRLVRMARNDGPCPARNAGLAAARCAWVLLLDNDAVLMPDALELLARAGANHPQALLLQPRSVFALELKLLSVLGLGPEVAETDLRPGARELLTQLTTSDWPDLAALKPSGAEVKALRQFLHGFIIHHCHKLPKGRDEALQGGL